MKGKGLFKSIGLVIVGSMVCISSVKSQDSVSVEGAVDELALVEDSAEVVEQAEEAPAEEEEAKEAVAAVVGDADLGRQYFEGSKRFFNGGPACISCHNVTNDKLVPGGLMAKDLTDVFERMDEGITDWLGAPPFPAMTSSYQNHELLNTVSNPERSSLTAFLKEAYETRDGQTADSGQMLFVVGGAGGLIGIFILVSLIWMNRKRQMVKKDIFARQSKAWDAKH